MRGLAIITAIVVLAVLGFALLFPRQWGNLEAYDMARLVFLLTLALFVGAGAWGMRTGRGTPLSLGRGLLYLAIWGGAFVIAVLLYQYMPAIRAAFDPNVRT
jgi:hypothetical protein